MDTPLHPETKQQPKQWMEAGESAPRKAKMVPSEGKAMATVFLGVQTTWEKASPLDKLKDPTQAKANALSLRQSACTQVQGCCCKIP